MEGDHREPPALAQQPLGGEQPLDQLVELRIDRDAQRLEAAGGRVRIAGLPPDGTLDQPRQLERRGNRMVGARCDDELRDAA